MLIQIWCTIWRRKFFQTIIEHVPNIYSALQNFTSVNSDRVDKLKTFNLQQKDPDSFLFVLAFGGDGAPSCGLSFLVSFINVSRRITSSSENFLIFGCDADECSESQRFILKVMSDIKALEGEVFILYVRGVCKKVEFKLGELPNDMKFLGFLAGEITNSAYYFLNFANVNQDSKKDVNRIFGFDDSKEKWRCLAIKSE